MSRENNDRNLYNRIAKDYAKKDFLPSSSIARKNQLEFMVKEENNNGSLGIILEIGCGIGASCFYLKDRYQKYIGIDYSEELITVANNNFADNDTLFICKNIKDLEPEDINYIKPDIILCVGVLHHIENIDKALEILHTIADEHTKFIAIEPYNGNIFIQLLRKVRTYIDKTYSSEQIFFAEKELVGVLQRNKLHNINTFFQGHFSTPFAQVILWPQKIFYPISKLVIKIDNFIDNHLNKYFKRLSWNIIVKANFKK